MKLTVDVGNTYVKLSVFKEDRVVFQDAKADYTKDCIINIIDVYFIRKAIISSVRDNITAIESYLEESDVEVFYLSMQCSLPIKISYGTPNTLGLDRIAAAVGAVQMFDNTNLVVIDMGTCNTYDYITHDKEFLGGNIAPGYKMRLDAMHYYTNKLPLLEVTEGYVLKCGKDTTSAIQAGAYHGIISEVEGVIKVASELFDQYPIEVVITGGAVKYVEKDFNFPCVIEPNLVHIGLNKILEYIDEDK